MAPVNDLCFQDLFDRSSPANKARLLSVSAPHATSWLSVIPSTSQGLHLDPIEFRVAVKWWLGLDTSQGSQCAFCPAHSLDPLGHHALTCKCGGDAVLRHNALRDTLVHFLHRAHASVQVEVGAGLFPDHSQSRPADILLQNWNLGRPVALDISVVSPLNPSTLAEAGATFGAVLEATESRKHQANDEKCSALGWVSTPLAVDSYGAWALGDGEGGGAGLRPPTPTPMRDTAASQERAVLDGLNQFDGALTDLIRTEMLQMRANRWSSRVETPTSSNAAELNGSATTTLRGMQAWECGQFTSLWARTKQHVSHHGPWSSPLDEDVKKITEAISLAKDGLLGKACQILTSDFNVLSILRSFPKASAAGPTGLRIQHLLDVAEVPVPTSICSLLRGVINLLASGQAPAAISQYMAGGSLVALRKGPFYFALVLHHLVLSISKDESCQDLLFNAWYLDDGVVAGPSTSVQHVLGSCDPQIALILLRMCGGFTKLVHVARSTPPSLALDELHAFDEQVRCTFTECQAIDTTDSSWMQAQLSLSRGGLGLRSLAHHSNAAFIASISTAGLASPSDNFLADAVNSYNRCVPPESAIDINSLTSPCRQHTLSAALENIQLNSLFSQSSVADKARLLSVSSPHASAWLSVVPSPGLGLSLDPNEHQMAIKWWLGLNTSPGSPPCALCPEHPLDPLGHHAVTCKRGGDAISRHNKLRDVVLQTCHRACISAKAEAASNWLCGKPAAFDLTVVSPLNPTFISEAGRTAGSAAVAAELRKHSANDAKCSELGWTCIPFTARIIPCHKDQLPQVQGCLQPVRPP
eukprot:Em0920g1a